MACIYYSSLFAYGKSGGRHYWSVITAAPGDYDRQSSEMHLEAMIGLNSEMHWEAGIERVWKCIWRPKPSTSEMDLESEIKLNTEMNTVAVSAGV